MPPNPITDCLMIICLLCIVDFHGLSCKPTLHFRVVEVGVAILSVIDLIECSFTGVTKLDLEGAGTIPAALNSKAPKSPKTKP